MVQIGTQQNSQLTHRTSHLKTFSLIKSQFIFVTILIKYRFIVSHDRNGISSSFVLFELNVVRYVQQKKILSASKNHRLFTIYLLTLRLKK